MKTMIFSMLFFAINGWSANELWRNCGNEENVCKWGKFIDRPDTDLFFRWYCETNRPFANSPPKWTDGRKLKKQCGKPKLATTFRGECFAPGQQTGPSCLRGTVVQGQHTGSHYKWSCVGHPANSSETKSYCTKRKAGMVNPDRLSRNMPCRPSNLWTKKGSKCLPTCTQLKNDYCRDNNCTGFEKLEALNIPRNIAPYVTESVMFVPVRCNLIKRSQQRRPSTQRLSMVCEENAKRTTGTTPRWKKHPRGLFCQPSCEVAAQNYCREHNCNQLSVGRTTQACQSNTNNKMIYLLDAHDTDGCCLKG